WGGRSGGAPAPRRRPRCCRRPAPSSGGDVMDGLRVASLDVPSMLSGLGWEFPFARELSLAPLIRFWDKVVAPADSLRGMFVRTLQTAVREAPELGEAINDGGVLIQHRELVEALMAAVFPAVFWEQEQAAALVPFELRAFYSTPAFERDLVGADG